MRRILLWALGISLTLGLYGQHPGNDTTALETHLSGAATEENQGKPGQPALGESTAPLPALDQSHASPVHCQLDGDIIYGFHPHWVGDAYLNYNYRLLTHVSYFAYQIDCATGGIKDIGDFLESPLPDTARQSNPDIHIDLTLTTNGSGCESRSFLADSKAVDTCIATVQRLMRSKKLDGICVDFEDIYGRDSTLFRGFLEKMKKGILEVNPAASLSVAGYASGIQSRQPLAFYQDNLDFVVVMGYDYYYSGAKGAGPVAPVGGPDWHLYSLERSIDEYLEGGMSKDKLVLALPYYGYRWLTNSTEFTANDALGKGKSVLYHKLIEDYLPSYTAHWDSSAQTSWFSKAVSGGTEQVWVPDSAAMARKIELVQAKGIAGMGMWALGYDHGQTALWDLLEARFMVCETSPVAPDSSITTGNDPVSDADSGAQSNNNWIWWGIGIAAVLVLLLLIFRAIRKG